MRMLNEVVELLSKKIELWDATDNKNLSAKHW